MKKPETDLMSLTPEALRFAAELMAMAGKQNAGGWYDLFRELMNGDSTRKWMDGHYSGPLKPTQIREFLEIGIKTWCLTHPHRRYDD